MGTACERYFLVWARHRSQHLEVVFTAGVPFLESYRLLVTEIPDPMTRLQIGIRIRRLARQCSVNGTGVRVVRFPYRSIAISGGVRLLTRHPGDCDPQANEL
jgi:hypothetical protein